MPPTLYEAPLSDRLLRRVAAWIWDASPERARGDLTGALVLLPAVRACATLRHELLEIARAEAGLTALLLPDLATPRQLVAALAARLGLGAELADAPPDGLRPLLLAARLPQLPWVAPHPESAAGLAAEMVRTFDEIRRAGAGESLAGAAPPAGAAALAGPGARAARQRQIHELDWRRVREAWRLYREAVPCDATDVAVAVAARLGDGGAGWPGPAYARVAVAGFAEADAALGRLLRAALAQGEGRVFLTAADDPLSRAFLSAWADPDAPSHPGAPERRLRRALGAGAGARGGDRAAAPSAGAPPRGDNAPPPRPALLSCGDPEEESRTIAGLVCEELAASGASARVAVATNDRALARRVVAQLRDAGVSDVDDSGGLPLSSLPAGRLVHFLLQCGATGLRHEPLLELLTHPWVRLAESRGIHSRRALLLEKHLLRGESPPSGLDAYRARAAWQDEAYSRTHGGDPGQLAPFVDRIGAALAPLLSAPAGPAPWRERLAGLRAAWQKTAPEQPLRAGAEPAAATPQDAGAAARRGARPSVAAGVDPRPADLVALGDLLDRLERLAARPGALAEVGRDEFAAELDRLLAAEPVRPRRSPFLPVQVLGLIEARLERFDLLIVAGANEEVWPGRVARPLFLGEAARAALGLPTWRERLGLEADLFLRLLHGAARVCVTWSRERDGQPALRSPFVDRLLLGLGLGDEAVEIAGRRPLYRQRPAPAAAIAASQAAFAAEWARPRPPEASAPLRRTSHSALGLYRACPYRFLLEKGYGLGEQDEVLAAFRKLDHGRVVHECLRRFLEPGAAGRQRLEQGDGAGALAALRQLAAEEFAAGVGELPQRRLWEEAFLAAAPAFVAAELARAAAWRPAALEREFRLDLGGLHAWLARELAPAGGAPSPAALAPEQAQLALTGWIDRVDLDPDGRRAAVIDYKTGAVPQAKAVKSGDEPQLTLYAVAVETGAVRGLPAGGLPVAEAGYYVLAPAEAGLSPRLECGAGAKDRDALAAGAQRILSDALAASDRGQPFPLVPGFRDGTAAGDPPCGYCPHRGVCRVDERELPASLRAKLAQPKRSR